METWMIVALSAFGGMVVVVTVMMAGAVGYMAGHKEGWHEHKRITCGRCREMNDADL